MTRYTHRHDARNDGNETEIVRVFESKGISVERIRKPLDLLLGYNKRNYLVEVKMRGKHLNDNQVKFTNEWKGQWIMIDTIERAGILADSIVANNDTGYKG